MPAQTTILWTGREYYSLENCLVNTTNTGSTIDSTIVGKYGETIYYVHYWIKTNQHWETVSIELKSRLNDRMEHLHFESDGAGNWTSHGKPAEQFKGCIDVDIPLTPFTNTLPINRLTLSPGEEQFIQVIYLDILQHQIIPVRQKYRCLSRNEYHYENVPNDFEATIKIDDHGFVVDYPTLFVRTAAVQSNYHE